MGLALLNGKCPLVFTRVVQPISCFALVGDKFLRTFGVREQGNSLFVNDDHIQDIFSPFWVLEMLKNEKGNEKVP